MNEYPGIAIVGPTASGKTRLGIALALSFQGEVVSCDAFQVYRHMNIGTGKVPASDQILVKHHMLDLRNPGQDFSAGDYERLARQALHEIRKRAHLPIVVGGTGFYLRALIDGLFEGPSRSESLRARLRIIIERRGAGTLHRALQRVDPETAGRIAESDTERIIRAYEVYLISGKPMSFWQQLPRDALRGYRWLKIGIHLPRILLYSRIDQRVDEMVQSGLVQEVQTLLEKFPGDSQAFKAIGYRQIAGYLRGTCSLEQAIEDTKKESRRYAKRQLTWFRSDPAIRWLDGQLSSEALLAATTILIREFLAQ
jgi:tRNA dimethylallyltransferase